MSIDSILSPQIQKITQKSAEATILIVAIYLGLDYFNILIIEQIRGSIWITVLWLYLILNAGAVNALKFWKNKNNPLCPKCKRKLDESKEYQCQKCGKIKFEK